jgi:mannose-1-phosphate guanylyltransferase
VILAGGDGKRLLPLTRPITGDDRPKQFCCVVGRQTLLQQTRRRLSNIIPERRTLVVLTKSHEPYYADELAHLAPSCLLIQPQNRGTAPAILYSLTQLVRRDPEGVVAFFPSDHHFSRDSALRAHITSAFREARSHPDVVILLGVTPDTPETAYGWIQPGAPLADAQRTALFQVERFWEKPSAPVARSLFVLGCLWNSFIMVGRVQTFLDLTHRALPELCRAFAPIGANDSADPAILDSVYAPLPSVSFSVQVLSAYPTALGVLRADGLGWSDLGEPVRVLALLSRERMRAGELGRSHGSTVTPLSA